MTTSAFSANPSGSRAHPNDDEEDQWEDLNYCLSVLGELEATCSGDDDAITRGMLTHIINEYPRSGNHLQPSENQHLLLSELVDTGRIYNPHSLTNSEWLEIVGDGSMLFDMVTPDAHADIVERASAVVNTLINTNESHVTLMDGHGRVVYQILADLKERGCNVDEFTFWIYDLDYDVNAWHEIFLPSSVESFHDDIFCSGENTLRAPEELPGVVYLNFCGIGGCVEQTIDMVSCLVRQRMRPVMVSYSTRGMSQDRVTGLRDFHNKTCKMTRRAKNKMCAQFISEHGRGSAHFVTYGFYYESFNPYNDPSQEDYEDYGDYNPDEESCDCEDDCYSDCECGCHEESCEMVCEY